MRVPGSPAQGEEMRVPGSPVQGEAMRAPGSPVQRELSAKLTEGLSLHNSILHRTGRLCHSAFAMGRKEATMLTTMAMTVTPRK